MAVAILEEREVDPMSEETRAIFTEIAEDQAWAEAEKEAPLRLGLRLLCLFLPGVGGLFVGGYCYASGRTRAGRDAFVWTAAGTVGYFLLGYLILGY